MNTKQKIIDEIKNGDKKDYYQKCIKGSCAFDIVVDGHKYEFRPRMFDPYAANGYLEHGAEAWSKDKTYEFKGKELEFVWAEEWAEKRAKWIDHLISIIPANIDEYQRKNTIKWIKSGNWDAYTIEEEVKSMQPWDMTTVADDDVLEALDI